MGGMLRLVQRWEDWAGPQPAQAPSRCTKCNKQPTHQRPVYQSPCILLYSGQVRCCADLMYQLLRLSCMIMGLDRPYHDHQYILVSHFNFFLYIPCGRLSCLPVSFLLNVKYTLSYRIVSTEQRRLTVFLIISKIDNLNRGTLWILLNLYLKNIVTLLLLFFCWSCLSWVN